MMKNEINELETQGIIVPSKSCYGARSFVKAKEDGKERLLID